MPINLSTLVERLNLRDKNITNLANTMERNIFEPLKEIGYIKSFEKDGSGHFLFFFSTIVDKYGMLVILTRVFQ